MWWSDAKAWSSERVTVTSLFTVNKRTTKSISNFRRNESKIQWFSYSSNADGRIDDCCMCVEQIDKRIDLLLVTILTDESKLWEENNIYLCLFVECWWFQRKFVVDRWLPFSMPENVLFWCFVRYGRIFCFYCTLCTMAHTILRVEHFTMLFAASYSTGWFWRRLGCWAVFQWLVPAQTFAIIFTQDALIATNNN